MVAFRAVRTIARSVRSPPGASNLSRRHANTNEWEVAKISLYKKLFFSVNPSGRTSHSNLYFPPFHLPRHPFALLFSPLSLLPSICTPLLSWFLPTPGESTMPAGRRQPMLKNRGNRVNYEGRPLGGLGSHSRSRVQPRGGARSDTGQPPGGLGSHSRRVAQRSEEEQGAERRPRPSALLGG